MKILEFEIIPDESRTISGKLGISEVRRIELEMFVMTGVDHALKSGYREMMPDLAIYAETVQEFGFMCRVLGQVDAQIFSRMPPGALSDFTTSYKRR